MLNLAIAQIDKAMFDAILEGATVDEALIVGEEQAQQDDDTELF